MPDPIRIAVVDDHPMLREGVVRTLLDERDIEVVGEGATADQAIDLAQKFLPDVMLLDMNMPGSGLTAIGRISELCPAIKLIVLTVQEDHDTVTQALKLGARAYALKGVGATELVDIVRAVHDGGSYVSPSLAAKLLANFNRPDRKGSDQEPIETLTAREEQILVLLGKGLRNKEIARQLDLKEKTVKHYVTNILQKLQLRNRVEAAVLLQKQAKSDRLSD
jgi:two-component system, NarL family, nitrate/nitrite response regulator NarL